MGHLLTKCHVLLLQKNNVTTPKLGIFDLFTCKPRNTYIYPIQERQNVSNTSKHQVVIVSSLNLPCYSHFSCLEYFKRSFQKIMIFALVTLFIWGSELCTTIIQTFIVSPRVTITADAHIKILKYLHQHLWGKCPSLARFFILFYNNACPPTAKATWKYLAAKTIRCCHIHPMVQIRPLVIFGHF